ncbi:precorrin-2 dehydrogenase/sirohydrochlorin ferrochelatase family protein [Bacillus piscicola]|uniref:precorrin-2 dehydrogenase/sirohydrochlorin ferrochelatase family protein n=1 Tax=Bacillus piscicola TaxID=1632684 RepID=UPI001F09BCA2|nr:bifunctional precorrin-2 dehydrogenase/sirohydrochlorin ferrochelatase [Bacillus piscicola]
MYNFPLFMDLNNKETVVIGGGKIASRKVQKLLAAAADVTVVSPSLHPDLLVLYKEKRIAWIEDCCRPAYLQPAFLIVSASGDAEAQAIIKRTAHAHQLVNGADNPEIGNVAFPAELIEEDCHIAISTNGKNPGRAKALKKQLKIWLTKNNYS